eukprot:1751095-Amphidinium_carterae.1
MQDAYVEEDTQYQDNKCPIQPTEDEADGLEDCNEIMMSIRKKRDEIISISQALSYALVHATKPGSEPRSMIRRSMIRRIMCTANGLEAWSKLNLHYSGGHRAQQFSVLRTIMSPQWNADKHFTKQYYWWLEDINRYESESHCGPRGDRDNHQSLLPRRLSKSVSLVTTGLCCLGSNAQCLVWGSRHLRAGVFGVAKPDSDKVRMIIDRRRKNPTELSMRTALHERGRKGLAEQHVHELRRYMTLPHALQLGDVLLPRRCLLDMCLLDCKDFFYLPKVPASAVWYTAVGPPVPARMFRGLGLGEEFVHCFVVSPFSGDGRLEEC